eukprot:CAMPEP_0204854896 /NCGR_PEP_ID=MMETSP1347-20130617/15860_1 /ASSEMBLY_ACC=CAM_ASM_000690 /TAXON_ID=215587 /ORGANISM="Aplanochytrium stocchinoi, Strain GSBS06" /LENGTH=42 /DNA_ID= /DNA_START= /DNA_END= /DNA_ORIENTATION=
MRIQTSISGSDSEDDESPNISLTPCTFSSSSAVALMISSGFV